MRLVCASLLTFLSLGSGVSAGDFSLTYALDADGKNDVGKIETCIYAKSCEIQPVGFRLDISITVVHPDHSSARLEVFGRDSCCYSADANRTIYLDIKPGLLRVPLYEGRMRKGNEFVRNSRYGILYLEFSNMR